jgi:hypothetical protein
VVVVEVGGTVVDGVVDGGRVVVADVVVDVGLVVEVVGSRVVEEVADVVVVEVDVGGGADVVVVVEVVEVVTAGVVVDLPQAGNTNTSTRTNASNRYHFLIGLLLSLSFPHQKLVYFPLRFSVK